MEKIKNQTNETRQEKNGNISVKASFLLQWNNENTKTELAKKVKECLKNAIIFKFENGNTKTTLTNDQMETLNNYFRLDIFASNEYAKNIYIKLLQENSKNALKNMYIDALASAYNSNGLKKDKESNTETIAKYGRKIASYSFVKFVKNIIEYVLTNGGHNYIVYNSITKAITYEEIDEAVEGIEE